MNTSNQHRTVRVSRPKRSQVEMHFHCLEELLPSGHRARLVWSYVQSLDLSELYGKIRVDRHSTGRSAIAPEILVSLWLLATLDSISSARELDRRCARDIAYMWICGGVSVNYHTLSDFRTQHCDFLEALLIDSVAALIDQDLVPLETIAQDGMRVRAHAGSSSFRRKPSLEQLQKEAADHLQQLRQESEEESSRRQADARRQSARERAARERQERIEEAIRQRDELAQKREKRKKGDGQETRCSTTDPDARRMKMANGGYDPAFNVQFASDSKGRVIVGVDVTNEGTDSGQLVPMTDRLESIFGKRPNQVLVDSAFATQQAVQELESKGTEVVAGIPRASQIEKHGGDPHAPQRRDSPEYELFRARMREEQYQELYRKRPSIAEFPNAVCRNQGLYQFPVRGLVKVKAIALWHALAFNFRRMLNLGILS